MQTQHAEATVSAASTVAPALQIIQLEKVFGSKGALTKALDRVDLVIERGEFVAIMGPSGSGKSTLLNCIATIESATAGQIIVDGHDVTRLRGKALTAFRRDEVGFVFQDGNLIDTLTAYENIALALSIQKAKADQIDKRVRSMAAELDVVDVLEKLPSQMSGGQRQRVAAARALVTQPKLVLADEPTGALDSRNARMMMESLSSMNAKLDATILMVTHDAFAASFAHRVVFVRDGRIFNQVTAGSGGRSELFDRVMKVQAFLGGEVARNDA